MQRAMGCSKAPRGRRTPKPGGVSLVWVPVVGWCFFCANYADVRTDFGMARRGSECGVLLCFGLRARISKKDDVERNRAAKSAAGAAHSKTWRGEVGFWLRG